MNQMKLNEYLIHRLLPTPALIESKYTAISINVVGLKLQAYESRPNGGMGIYLHLHISLEEIYKFVFLHVEYLFVFP